MWVQYNVKEGREVECEQCGEWIMPLCEPARVWLLIIPDEALIVQRLICDPCYQRDHGELAMLLPCPPENTTDGASWGEPVLTAAGRAKLTEIQGGLLCHLRKV